MIALESMAVVMPEVAGHPNRRPFQGVLTVVDVASQRAPSGAKGHLVVLTRSAAEAALPSLLGMALDYAPTLDRHDVRRKVGVITRAELVGRKLEVGGYLFAKDFPEIVEAIAKSGGRNVVQTHPGTDAGHSAGSGLLSSAERVHSEALGRLTGTSWRRTADPTIAHRGIVLQASSPVERPAMITASGGAGLGMSYEVMDVLLADTRARVWLLTKVTFTGAAILRRDKAAYQDTWIELG